MDAAVGIATAARSDSTLVQVLYNADILSRSVRRRIGRVHTNLSVSRSSFWSVCLAEIGTISPGGSGGLP